LLLAVVVLAGGALAWRATRDAGQETLPAASEVEAVPVVAVDEVEPGVETEEPKSEEPPTEREDPKTGTESETAATGAQHPSTEESEAASDQPKPKPRAEPVVQAPASLTVVVYPWGDVWINGTPRGTAPLKNLALKPGRYRIGAGQGEPTVTQTIRLRPGQKKKLKLDVTK
jgi:hypothetical protein